MCKIESYQKKVNLNSDKKRNWFSELKSLNDKTKCDSAAIPADIVSNLISNEEIDWLMKRVMSLKVNCN
ncbi:MAG: hypothetical protein OEL81_00535 [Nitrosopumilus sp.]|nr:hypothetical protein [Nitrosopumilus sp.]